jgi:Undecaprenyl-phosphate glucose phosphotransferase
MFIVAFMTKQSVEYSRGWILSFYAVGLAALLALELATLAIRKAAIVSGMLLTRRLLVVGNSVDIAKFARTCSFDSQGIEIVAAAEIARNVDETRPSAEQDAPSVQAAIAAARKDNVSDIVILTDWKDARASAMIAEMFLDVPAAVHLVGLDVFEQFSQLGVDQVGRAKTIVIRRQPLSVLQAAVKRGFDISVASIALLLLAPFLILTAILIRLDTRGPAFFLQRRRGFNHKEFRIFKFRTMTTADDGDQIRQATNNDPRITRLGRILRKYNIDELPQLINVLLGHMSLVGPRPHAVAHDGYYERIIRRYGRRLNMRPGITGWAQINGHRGETATRAAMEARVEHDLHYIENWSVALDIYVLLMTIVSRRAYRNAI